MMKTTHFDSFAEASVFAKQISMKLKVSARLFKRSTHFLVEWEYPENACNNIQVEAVKETDPRVINAQAKQPLENKPISHAPVSLPSNIRLCIDCASVIPKSRVEASPNVFRCIKCQSEYEQTHDTRSRISEGIGGTREQNIRMRYRGGVRRYAKYQST